MLVWVLFWLGMNAIDTLNTCKSNIYVIVAVSIVKLCNNMYNCGALV